MQSFGSRGTIKTSAVFGNRARHLNEIKEERRVAVMKLSNQALTSRFRQFI